MNSIPLINSAGRPFATPDLGALPKAAGGDTAEASIKALDSIARSAQLSEAHIPEWDRDPRDITLTPTDFAAERSSGVFRPKSFPDAGAVSCESIRVGNHGGDPLKISHVYGVVRSRYGKLAPALVIAAKELEASLHLDVMIAQMDMPGQGQSLAAADALGVPIRNYGLSPKGWARPVLEAFHQGNVAAFGEGASRNITLTGGSFGGYLQGAAAQIVEGERSVTGGQRYTIDHIGITNPFVPIHLYTGVPFGRESELLDVTHEFYAGLDNLAAMWNVAPAIRQAAYTAQQQLGGMIGRTPLGQMMVAGLDATRNSLEALPAAQLGLNRGIGAMKNAYQPKFEDAVAFVRKTYPPPKAMVESGLGERWVHEAASRLYGTWSANNAFSKQFSQVPRELLTRTLVMLADGDPAHDLITSKGIDARLGFATSTMLSQHDEENMNPERAALGYRISIAPELAEQFIEDYPARLRREYSGYLLSEAALDLASKKGASVDPEFAAQFKTTVGQLLSEQEGFAVAHEFPLNDKRAFLRENLTGFLASITDSEGKPRLGEDARRKIATRLVDETIR